MSQGSYESGIGRRDILCSGGSVVFSSLIAALLGDAKPARAQTISGSVPPSAQAARSATWRLKGSDFPCPTSRREKC
jgi:hypothetical protein